MKISGFILSLTLCTVHAGTILDYTGSPHGPGGPLVASTFASSFTVGARAVELSSISFGLGGYPSMEYDTTAYIFSNSGDHPGTLIGSSHRSFGFGDFPGQTMFNFYDYAFSGALSLAAGGTYWAALGKADSGYPLYIYYTSNLGEFTDDGAGPSLTHCTTLSYPPDGQWGVNTPSGRIRALPPERRLQAAAVIQTVLLPPEGGVPIRRQPEIRGQCADAPLRAQP